jgi:uncharacterized protein (DUF849 family)
MRGVSERPDKLIVNACLTGMVPTRADSAAVPLTPHEIAADARRCRDAGAAIVHLHARDADGMPTSSGDVYAEVVGRVRELVPDVIVCVSTSGRLRPDFESRAEVLDLDGDLKPELASLTLGSLNFPNQASVNAPDVIRRLAERMLERGIVPELEAFELGMLDYARFLIAREVLRPPYYVNLLLGSLGTLGASPANLATLAASVPPGATWSATGIGRFQFWVNAMAVTMGGHVRVGLEDNLWLDVDRTVPATNEQLVQRVVALAAAYGREAASPDEARALLGLPQRAAVVAG